MVDRGDWVRFVVGPLSLVLCSWSFVLGWGNGFVLSLALGGKNGFVLSLAICSWWENWVRFVGRQWGRQLGLIWFSKSQLKTDELSGERTTGREGGSGKSDFGKVSSLERGGGGAAKTERDLEGPGVQCDGGRRYERLHRGGNNVMRAR